MRRLPWRLEPSPYHTWVSEIMLQQTQVATAIPYYQRFLARFPDVDTLAAADLGELLALWQGLGYYSRARNLHAAARDVVRLHGSQLPDGRAALLALPGIGDYTAGAILSIAYNLDYVAVDGNVKRILARVLDYDREIASSANAAELACCARALLPSGQASTFNQAMMDLGATICTPRQPLCDTCPVAIYCLARESGVQEQRPVRAPRATVPVREMVGAIVERADGFWLALRRNPQGLLGGLWEIPVYERYTGDTLPPDARLIAALAETLHLEITTPGAAWLVTHAYTHFRVRLTLYRCVAQNVPVLVSHDTWNALQWLNDANMPAHGLTGLTLKALRAVQAQRNALL